MGGCCCSSRKHQLHGTTPIYYYCPPALEEQGSSFASDDSVATAGLSSRGFLVELNLDTSTPDTYRAPPTPIPYGVVNLQTRDFDSSVAQRITGCNFETLSECLDLKQFDRKGLTGHLLVSPGKFDVDLVQSNDVSNNSESEDEEDVCPICLEEYDEENPELTTNCDHHFHFSCILEWMQRNGTCPICNQEIILGDQ